MNEKAKKLALRVADHVERLEWCDSAVMPGKEDPCFTMQATHYACGAPACIAGWAVHLGTNQRFDSLPRGGFHQGGVMDIAATLLDIDHEASELLFTP